MDLENKNKETLLQSHATEGEDLNKQVEELKIQDQTALGQGEASSQSNQQQESESKEREAKKVNAKNATALLISALRHPHFYGFYP